MSAAPTPDPSDAVAVLRDAAEVLRRTTRDRPRGPWRWGDPDVDEEPGPVTVDRRDLWPIPPHTWPSPLDEPAPLGRHHRTPGPGDLPPLRVRPAPAAGIDLDVAEPLAALLDLLAGQVERDARGAEPETVGAATEVARSVLRSSAAPSVDG